MYVINKKLRQKLSDAEASITYHKEQLKTCEETAVADVQKAKRSEQCEIQNLKANHDCIGEELRKDLAVQRKRGDRYKEYYYSLCDDYYGDYQINDKSLWFPRDQTHTPATETGTSGSFVVVPSTAIGNAGSSINPAGSVHELRSYEEAL